MNPHRAINWLLMIPLISITLLLCHCQGPAAIDRSVAQQPADWRPLFDGKTLTGWKGLVGNPYSRNSMSPEQLAAAQIEADRTMRGHWSVQDAILCFDGKGSHLCTSEDFSDFILELEWKIEVGGDSGIYLRGCPQVQIWDAQQNPVGSGGLYNNQQAESRPLVAADHPVGQWNRFRITMIDKSVTVQMNDKLVVDRIPLENYWQRGSDIPRSGQIELQSHGSHLWFRNIRIFEL